MADYTINFPLYEGGKELYIALKRDAVILEPTPYRHAAPDAEYLKKTHMPLYRAVRAKQPNLPIIFVSSADILQSPEWFIPRREVIRETYQTALEEGDKNVYFIDGAELIFVCA